ncbi:putative toxin-antitoxin system toxin component, PIN family [Echinicola strongylocentroti]|uniref:Putative toxin-antitoxin system toxin component, PIN family n=1 Tax=Echinicola strongylocentroti TaxID=1795355 RepID=A0A2Z4IE61_9BACT|nr:putative toxin-antitoxin system toxin component, PIN family [Echinicola strongylocentroti]AWW29109.1 putative toxin-antitoxin system toxin component, PIN family [Echinicola strongylocentroti]
MKSKKIVLDTNLWISFLISKDLIQLDELIATQKIKLVFSLELIEEFIEVVSRPKFKKYFSTNDIENILEYFDQYGQIFKVKSTIKACRDEKDDFLLNLSIDSKADFLITGDKDLLSLGKIEKTKIMTFKEFTNFISFNYEKS